jgi:hypothetical protein
MRILRVLLCSVVFAACGGDDDGGSTIDANTDRSDAEPRADAAPTVTGIGQVCSPPPSDTGCPEAASTCFPVSGSQSAYCTRSCGTFATGAFYDDIPAEAHQGCDVDYTGSATAACILAGEAAGDGMTVYYCGLICDSASTNLGTCDEPFTCDHAQGQTFGFCRDQ